MYNRRYTGKIELAVLDTAGTFCDGPGDLRHRWPLDDLRGCKAPVVPVLWKRCVHLTLNATGLPSENPWVISNRPI